MKKTSTQTEILDFEARMKALRSEIIVEVEEEIPSYCILPPYYFEAALQPAVASRVPLVQSWIGSD